MPERVAFNRTHCARSRLFSLSHVVENQSPLFRDMLRQINCRQMLYAAE